MRPYPVPKLHAGMSKNEVEILVSLGVIKKTNGYDQGALYFYQPKPKTNRVHFLSNFWNLNQ